MTSPDNTRDVRFFNHQASSAHNNNEGDQDKRQPESDNGKKRKYTRKNFDPDGHIRITAHQGKDRSDSYLKRSKTLTRGCEQLHTITKCHVKLTIQPTLYLHTFSIMRLNLGR